VTHLGDARMVALRTDDTRRVGEKVSRSHRFGSKRTFPALHRRLTCARCLDALVAILRWNQRGK
jgi:hypothetical protein